MNVCEQVVAELQQQLESSEREKQTVKQQLTSSQRLIQELRQTVSLVCLTNAS